MKKLAAWVLVLIGLFGLAACGQTVETEEAREEILHPEDRYLSDPGQWGLSLEAENVTDSGLTILCRHSGGENVAEFTVR